MQLAACGAILHRKLKAEGTERVIPREWLINTGCDTRPCRHRRA
jgi:hypothetical protein